jgi:hypothetical protein
MHSQKNRARRPAAGVGEPVLTTLQKPDVLNAVEALSLVTADSTVRVAKVGGVWVAPDRHNHPVKFEDVRQFIRTLADLKVGQSIPGGEKELASLNLRAPSAGTGAAPAEGAGTLVTVSDKNGKALASLILGKARTRGGEMSFPDGRFVLADGKPSLVAETFHSLPAKSVDWMDTQLVDVFSSDLASLSWTPAGKPALTLATEVTELKLAGLATNERMDSVKSGKLSGIVSYLRFADVASPALSPADTGLDKPDTLVANARNGRSFTVRIGKATTNAMRHVAVSAAFTAPPLPEAPKEETIPGDKKQHEDAVKARKGEDDKLAAEIRALNERIGKWVYLVEASRFENLPMERKDLLLPPEETKPANTNMPPAAAAP